MTAVLLMPYFVEPRRCPLRKIDYLPVARNKLVNYDADQN